MMKYLKEKFMNRTTLLLFGFVVLVMYAPVWGGFLLYALFRWRWCFYAASAYLAFWAGPFTPFFPCCVAITLFIKKLLAGRKTWTHPRNPRMESEPLTGK